MTWDFLDITIHPDDSIVTMWTYEEQMLNDAINLMPDGALYVHGVKWGEMPTLYNALQLYLDQINNIDKLTEILRQQTEQYVTSGDSELSTAFKVLLQMTNKNDK